MIPKIIHRVWISDDLPDPNTDIGKCFYSQEKLKDYGYEIRTYTAKNFDFSISKYLLQAYSLKKWAFVTDYIRLWALYNFGGIYMDCDVEIIKSFDELLPCKYFFGAKYKSWEAGVNDHGKNFPAEGGLHNANDFLFDAGVFGAEKNNYIIKLLYDYYNNYNFIEHNGYIHDKNWTHYGYCPDYIEYKINYILTKHNYNKIGFIDNISKYIDVVNSSDIKKDIYILNTAFLTDCNYKKHMDDNKDCICIHHGIGSWINESPVYFHDYPYNKQIEYYKIFNENKLTKPKNNIYDIYLYTKNISNDVLYFDENYYKIIHKSNINEIKQLKNTIIINYDGICNMQLFKYLLKNLPDDSCIITKEYKIQNAYNINIHDIEKYLLIKYDS